MVSRMKKTNGNLIKEEYIPEDPRRGEDDTELWDTLLQYLWDKGEEGLEEILENARAQGAFLKEEDGNFVIRFEESEETAPKPEYMRFRDIYMIPFSEKIEEALKKLSNDKNDTEYAPFKQSELKI